MPPALLSTPSSHVHNGRGRLREKLEALVAMLGRCVSGWRRREGGGKCVGGSCEWQGTHPLIALQAAAHLTIKARTNTPKRAHKYKRNSDNAHLALSRSPHLLASEPARLKANAERVRALLMPGAAPEAVADMLVRQPRLLSTRPETLDRKAAAIAGVFGVSKAEVCARARVCMHFAARSCFCLECFCDAVRLRNLAAADNG